MSLSKLKIFVLFFILLVLYALLSYSLTTENLVLTTLPFYWQFQEYMWETFLGNRQLLVGVFTFIILVLFLTYSFLLKKVKSLTTGISLKKIIIFYIFLISPLLFAYNALSTDVFNYIFNSRIVVKYQENPREVAPIEFAPDPWQRFMVNNYHPSPYGYGWIGLAIIPYVLGFGKFILTWLAYKLFALLSLLILIFAVIYLHRVLYNSAVPVYDLALLFLNPLLLIEVLGNFHNDLWMMIPAMVSIGLLLHAVKEQKNKGIYLVFGLLLYLFSISIKLGTLALLPISFLLVTLFIFRRIINLALFQQLLEEKWLKWLPVFGAMLMFLPLLTVGSQRFHPWYFLWVLAWLPLIKHKLLRYIILFFSFSSLLRYIPWLFTGEYSSAILFQQQIITFVVPLGLLVIYLIYSRITHLKA